MMLKAEHVAIAFGAKRVLEDVSLEVAPRETVAIMGPNGAGKTTFLRCVLALLRFRGTISVDGFDVQRDGVRARRRIGYVPQAPAFYATMTAREVVRFVARLRGVARAEADGALARVGLEADAGRPVRVFSGGMLQRLSVAAALLGDPPLILLDEPTANLDPEARGDLLNLLGEFRAAGKTLVLSSHRPREVRGFADRVIVIRDGRVAQEGRPDEVLPQERVEISIEAHGADEKLHVAAALVPLGTLPCSTRNGAYEVLVPATRAAEAVERLRAAGVAAGRIALRPEEKGGEA